MEKNFSLAKTLMEQIENRDEQCARWFISAVDKLKQENPKMSISSLYDVLVSSMPLAADSYLKYKKNTY